VEYAAWKLFIDAAEHGSLSKVAVAYGTSQPHISRRISELEQDCGGRLFERTGRGVALTEFGQRIAPQVRAWLAGTEQLANDVRSSAGTPIGKVRLGSLPSMAHPLVSTLHKRLKERFPLVQLSVREGQGAQLETWLEDGSVDLGILYRTGRSPTNGDVYLVETSTYLVGAAGDALTARKTVPFAALNDLPLVQFCRPNSWRDHLEQIGAEHDVSLNVVLEADSLSLQTRIASEGGIYALLGPYAVAAASKDCRIQSSKIVDPVVTRHIALAMSRHGSLSLACRTVMQMLREIAKSGAAGLRRV
jgi:LysR family nitrogen assimilation transcriptional regulator